VLFLLSFIHDKNPLYFCFTDGKFYLLIKCFLSSVLRVRGLDQLLFF